MIENNQEKEFHPDEMYEEEFEIVRMGESALKKPGPNLIWQFVIVVCASTAAFFIGRLDFMAANKSPIVLEEGASVADAAPLASSASSPQNVKSAASAKKQSVSTAGQTKPIVQTSATSAPAMQPLGGYVASKSGTKYYLPWCGAAKKIKEENKVWFATKADAEKAGYTPASNCPGL